MAALAATGFVRCYSRVFARVATPSKSISRRKLYVPAARSCSTRLNAAALGLKPLRAMTSKAASETASQFPSPSTVAYDQSLANSVHLIGSVGVNPDIKYLDSGRIVATSSLSVKKTAQGDPTWFFLEFQSDLAEIAAQHIRKGDRIHVAGRIGVDNVVEDDVSQVIVKVDVTEVHFVDDTYGAKATAKPPQMVVQRGTFAKSSAPSGGRTEKMQATEKMWKAFYANPGEWYDNRDNKRNPKSPDFKHKTTGDALWIEGFYNPANLGEEIAKLEAKGLLKKVEAGATSTPVAASSSGDDEFKPF